MSPEASGASVAPDDSAPTTELLTGVVGDRCPNCQSPMAADQRYCLNCGERRGRARFSPETLATQTTTVTSSAAGPPPPIPRSRMSAGTTLVAGVATLLLALGVGVLIGHNNSSTPARSQAAQIITVPGAGAGTAANTGAASSSAPAVTAADKKHKVAKATVVHVTAKTAKAATAAASKVLGSSKNLAPNVQQGINQPCSGGQGCQNGKFTGNFFPGG